ncbi:uncharacterized protein LOC135956688 [Calliphora vicina]|uniref:uncharacterized protein LOC135956688 n=1 Tax=Calliphora vicina TaxID=7373 RepID=UPI00325B8018
MLLLKMIYNSLMAMDETFETDKRLNSYPFLGKPWPMLAVVGLYLLIVLKWGPKFMANRNPYKVDGLMKLYNVLQIVINSLIFFEALKYSYWRDDFKMICEKYDPHDTRPVTMKLVRPALLYYISKYLDIFDTIFFLVRKKFNQITFLHVYHHSLMIMAVYIYCNFLFSSHFTATGVLNSFIHICMYAYYLLAASKPNINLEPWKRTLTGMQLIQFVFLAVHFGVPLLNNWCKLPILWLMVAFVQNSFMIVLFSNFYYKTYILKDLKKRKNIEEMFYVLKYLYCLVAEVYAKNADPRVQHLPLVYSPLPMVVILTSYLAFVLHYGPKWMEHRQAFQLKYIMRVYNAVQVVANILLFVYGIPNSYGQKNFSFTCQPVDPTNTEPWMMRLLYITYGYYLTKYLDLFDTIFIVLRKKDQQISFLHVYHHTGMVFGVYVFMTFLPGSHSTMLGLINLLVHTVMYSYYFVTSMTPVKETLWWKRHITQLQLVQFGYLTVHFLLVIVRNTCAHPLAVAFVGFMQNIFMFALFFEFYYKAYLKKSKATDASNHIRDANDRLSQRKTEEKLKSS